MRRIAHCCGMSMKPNVTLADRRYARAIIVFAVAATLISGFYLVSNKSHRSGGRNDGKRPSTTNIAGGKSPIVHTPDLRINSIIHHGRIVEVVGSAEPGDVVMINGEPAATLFDNNTFKHFIGPVSAGTSIVTVTAQNDEGGVTTRQLLVTVD